MTERRLWLGLAPILLWAASAVGWAVFGVFAMVFAPHILLDGLLVGIGIICAGGVLIAALPLLLPMPKPWERLPPPREQSPIQDTSDRSPG